MELYQGSLRQFAEELLANGKGNGQMVEVAQFCETVIEDAKRQGLELRSSSILVMQKQSSNTLIIQKPKKVP